MFIIFPFIIRYFFLIVANIVLCKIMRIKFVQNEKPHIAKECNMGFYLVFVRTLYPTWLPGFTLPRREVTLRLPSKLTAERIMP